MVSITDFGASPGAIPGVNTTAIYAAMAASANVEIPAGTYQTGPIVISRAGLTMSGAGILTGATGLDALVSIVAADVTLSGIGLVAGGNVCIYAAFADRVHLSGVSARGGQFAGVFIDRCAAPVLSGVTVTHVRGSGGEGLWIMRGGSGAVLTDVTVSDVDGNGLSIDAGTTGDVNAAYCDGATLSNIRITNVGLTLADSAGLHLSGARNVTAAGVRIDGAYHGIVCEQDQSAYLAQDITITGADIRRVQGYAVALIGALRVSISGVRDATGVGPVFTQNGALGAVPAGNTVALDRLRASGEALFLGRG